MVNLFEERMNKSLAEAVVVVYGAFSGIGRNKAEVVVSRMFNTPGVMHHLSLCLKDRLKRAFKSGGKRERRLDALKVYL